MRRRAVHCLFLGVVLGLFLAISMPPRLFGTAHAAGQRSAPPQALRLNAAATPSGAANAYPLNETFDAAVQAVGTPPQNSGFEAAPQNVGIPPQNSGFTQAPAIAGTPPQNYNFATGSLSGWSGTGSVKSDPNHGNYADLNWSTITSSPFTIDPSTQTFTFDVDYLASSTSAMYVYVLSGSGYSTSTQMTYLNCNWCGLWRTESVNIAPFKGQSVEIQFRGYYSEIGVTNVKGTNLFPGFSVSGNAGLNTEQSGNTYAALLSSNDALTSSPFTIDPSAQTASVRIYGLSSAGNSYQVNLLSGAIFSTSTQMAYANAPVSAWVTVPFNVSAYAGQQVEVQVVATTFYNIGVDDVGLMTANVPGWSTSGTTSEVAGGPTGQYLSTNATVTSSPFTLAAGEQQLALNYRGGSAGSEFYLKLLSGPTYSTVTDLAGIVAADPNTWNTLKAAVQSFAGQQVELQIQQYFGTGLFDNAGLGEVTVPGWSLTSTNPVAPGSDSGGNFVTPFNSGGTLDLQSAPVNPGIVAVTSPSYRYYAISSDIGYSTGNLLQVTWTNSSNQSWVVYSAAANSPTGFQTQYFPVGDFQGTTGTFSVHLAGGGKLYSLGDNIARQQVAEPFSQKVGQQIDTSTGAFAFQDHDLDIQGGPLPVTLTRYYNGHSGAFGTLGYRWTDTYDTHLAITGDATEDVGIDFGSGAEEFFQHNLQTGVFTPADGRVHDTLVLNPDGTYTFTATQSNLTYHFTATGVLLSISDPNSNIIALAYDGSGRLATVTDPGGRALTFAYNSSGRLATVTDPTGAVVTYGYDPTTGDLTTVTDPLGHERSYSYSKHRLASFTDQNGQTQFSNTMDAFNRVTQQTDALGKTIAVAYSTPAAGVTQVTDPENNTALYYFDLFHRTTDKVDPQGHDITNIYDSSGNLEKIVDPANNTWTFAYDGSGAPTALTDPLNDPLTTTYNPQHLPTTITDARGNTTTDAYDAEGNLISAKDPLNDVTTYTYDTRGNRLTETDPLGHTTTYTYDVKNNQTSKTDANGNVWQWTYDGAGRKLTETDPDLHQRRYGYDLWGNLVAAWDGLNQETTYIYDPVGDLLEMQDPLGNTWFWGVDSRGLVTSRTDPAGKVTTFTYDNNRNMTSMTDPLGNESQWTYDPENRVIAKTDSLNRTTTYAYTSAGRMASMTDPLNRTTTYGYDAAGNLTMVTLPNNAVVTYSYDKNGNLTGIVDPLNHTTTYTSDANNRRTSVTDPLLHTTTYTYDVAGRQVEVTDPLNLVTRSAYDPGGRLTSTTDPMNAATVYAYDRAGNRTGVTDPMNRATAFAYDADNQLMAVTDPTSATTTTTYDAGGRVTRVTQPSGAYVANTYDPRGLLLTESDALAHTTTYGYDVAGRQVSVTDPNNATTTTAYDAAGQVGAITDALGGVVHFGYDAAGQQTSVTNARSKTTTYTYDALGDVVTTRAPLNRTQTSQYDLLGRLTQTTDARGIAIGYSYDAAGNQTAETYPGGGSDTWAYDADNRRTAMTDITGMTVWGYDAASRVTSVGAPQGGVISTYNADGTRATMTLPGGKTVAYGYDNVGRLSSVGDWLGRAMTFGYNADGQQIGIGRPDGITTTKLYDGAGRLTSVSHTGPGNTTLRHFTYTLDAAGNRTSVATEGGTESYALDALGRLTGVTYPQGDTAAYSYDPNGNRLTETSSLTGNAVYTYDDADELLSDGTSSYTYDANGNLLTAGSSVYSWDFANRLATSSVAGVTSIYAYDGDGTRVAKTVGGMPTTPYVWDREADLPMLAGDGSSSYLSDLSGSELGQLDGSNNPSYYLSDALGSVRGVTGTAGTLLGAGDYDVFGMERPGGTLTGSIRFAGEQWDGETNASYLRARTMNAPLGRFLSADSALPNGPGTQGYNAYSYAANNPANLTDPGGHDATSSVSAVNPGLVPFAPLNFVAIPLTLAMPGALVACVQYVPGCAGSEPVAEGEAESALPQAEGPGAGALGVWAVICWLTPECLTEAFLWIDIVCNAWGGDACAVPLPGPGPRPAPTTEPSNPRNIPPEPSISSPTPPGPCRSGEGPLPISDFWKGHILRNHALNSKDRGGKFDGKYFTDDWSTIEGLIQNGLQRPPPLLPDPEYPGTCAKISHFPFSVGWNFTPNRDGSPTPCIKIVTDLPATEVKTAFPIKC